MARGQGCTSAQTASPRRTGSVGERAEATFEEVAARFPQHTASAWSFLNGATRALPLFRGNAAAPRHALEAVLAAAAGQPEDRFAAENAARSWTELFDEAQTGEAGYDDRSLHQIAAHLENDLRRYAEGRVWTWLSPRRTFGEAASVLANAANKQGPGRNSGRLEDYTRSELCKLLGYLVREADGISDEELRAMALDAGLVPRFRGSPSHVELAYRAADGVSGSTRLKLRYFRETLRLPYAKALSKHTGDFGDRDPFAIVEELRVEHPWLAHALTCSGKRNWVMRFAEHCSIPTKRDEADRYTHETETRFVSSLERRHGETLYKRLEGFGGGKLTKIVGHGADGQWAALKPGKHTLAYFAPNSGELHVGPELDKIIRNAEQGKASPLARYAAVQSLDHELWHAASGGNGGSGYEEKSAEHTIEEGEVEILSRLGTDTLGRELGLCGPDESLRAEGRQTHLAYPREAETMIAIYAAATGELDPDWCEQGGYREPEGLSEEARQLVRDLHTGTDLYARTEALAERIAPRCGLPVDDVRMELRKTLRLSKNLIFDQKFSPNVDQRRKLFSEYLADRMRKLLNGTLTA